MKIQYEQCTGDQGTVYYESVDKYGPGSFHGSDLNRSSFKSPDGFVPVRIAFCYDAPFWELVIVHELGHVLLTPIEKRGGCHPTRTRFQMEVRAWRLGLSFLHPKVWDRYGEFAIYCRITRALNSYYEWIPGGNAVHLSVNQIKKILRPINKGIKIF